MNYLHDLEISLVYYNDITKKTCLIPYSVKTSSFFSPKNARGREDRDYITARKNRKHLHVACETIRRTKLLKLSKLYEVNHVEGVNMNNMYTLLYMHKI